MSANSKISWTDSTWNPVVGCTKVSAGCKNCYANELHDMRYRARLAGKRMPEQYALPFEKVQLLPDRLGMPSHWRAPRRIFVNSVSDLFHEDVRRLKHVHFAQRRLSRIHEVLARQGV